MDAVIASVATFCSKMDVEMLCGGVETIVQKERLLDLGCEKAQGFHFGKPMVLAEFHRWLRSHEARLMTRGSAQGHMN